MAVAKEKDPVYDKSELVAAANKIFKVNPEIMVGALIDVDQPISVADATKKLEAFLKKPIGGAK